MPNQNLETKHNPEDLVYIEGGTFLMGTDSEEGFDDDNEGPATEVTVEDFYITPYTVTNQDFLAFFLDTGYVTDAERYGSSNVFHLLLSEEMRERLTSLSGTSWWYEVPGASWRKPEGEGSSIKDRMDHPVVHVSRNDALAYCRWAGMRLPTEAEWEYAARGGLHQKRFPWGDELEKDGKHHANIWQGEFPRKNTEEDGYLGTAPVHAFEPNGYGLYQTSGNVWEWCLNPARIPLHEFQEKSSEQFLKENTHYSEEEYALRGGSFLCHCSYCQRYRVAGRNGNTATSSTSNMGFRCVKDVKKVQGREKNE